MRDELCDEEWATMNPTLPTSRSAPRVRSERQLWGKTGSSSMPLWASAQRRCRPFVGERREPLSTEADLAHRTSER